MVTRGRPRSKMRSRPWANWRRGRGGNASTCRRVWRGRVALPRDRRCMFIERATSKRSERRIKGCGGVTSQGLALDTLKANFQSRFTWRTKGCLSSGKSAIYRTTPRKNSRTSSSTSTIMGTIASKESCPLERGFRPNWRPPDQSVQHRHHPHEHLLNGMNSIVRDGLIAVRPRRLVF